MASQIAGNSTHCSTACPGLIENILSFVTHWGRVTHICVGKLTIIGSDNSFSPGRRQAIIWTNAGILLIEPLGTNLRNFNRNWNIFIQENAFENIVCEMASILSRPQCGPLLLLLCCIYPVSRAAHHIWGAMRFCCIVCFPLSYFILSYHYLFPW